MAIFIVISLILVELSCGTSADISKKAKCLNPPRTAKRVEAFIKGCQEEVKNKIVKEAFQLLRNQFHSSESSWDHYSSQSDLEDYQDDVPHIYKRSTLYHPTLVPHEDKRIAGCLLHCVYAKNNAIDKFGWPTLDGLVEFYSEGVNEHGFFMATLRAVNVCLRTVTKNYRINRYRFPEKGESCDLAFDVFDCISDQITSYCFSEYHHD